MTTFTATVSKTGQVKIPADVLARAKVKPGAEVTVALAPARARSTRAKLANPKAFSRILDEVVRDYATTLRKLA